MFSNGVYWPALFSCSCPCYFEKEKKTPKQKKLKRKLSGWIKWMKNDFNLVLSQLPSCLQRRLTKNLSLSKQIGMYPFDCLSSAFAQNSHLSTFSFFFFYTREIWSFGRYVARMNIRRKSMWTANIRRNIHSKAIWTWLRNSFFFFLFLSIKWVSLREKPYGKRKRVATFA